MPLQFEFDEDRLLLRQAVRETLAKTRALAGRLPAGSGTGVFDGAGRFVLDADRADEVARRRASASRSSTATALSYSARCASPGKASCTSA